MSHRVVLLALAFCLALLAGQLAALAWLDWGDDRDDRPGVTPPLPLDPESQDPGDPLPPRMEPELVARANAAAGIA